MTLVFGSDYWYTGNKKYECSWLGDKPHGKGREWYPNGKIRLDYYLYKGKLHEMYQSYFQFKEGKVY
jgi:antitoxin component YwqK of YwqJK toxin-antitoxin module